MGPRSVEILAAENRELRKLLASLGALVELPAADAPEPSHPAQPQERKKQMAITASKTVRELAVELPGAARVFEKLGIDYCCGGAKSLQDACGDARLAVEEVIRSLDESESARQAAAVLRPAQDGLSPPKHTGSPADPSTSAGSSRARSRDNRAAHVGHHLVDRGRLYLQVGRVDEAEQLFREALPHIHARRRIYQMHAKKGLEEIEQWLHTAASRFPTCS